MLFESGSISGTGTTINNGRSSHLGSGMAITAQFETSGCPIAIFSTSIELIHSPPDLIRSLARSVIVRNPSESIVATSPVPNQPSASIASRVASGLL